MIIITSLLIQVIISDSSLLLKDNNNYEAMLKLHKIISANLKYIYLYN